VAPQVLLRTASAMAHSEVQLSTDVVTIAADYAGRRWSAILPDYIPEWQLSGSKTRLEDDRTLKLRTDFRDWDADSNGTISKAELTAVFRKLGVKTQREIDIMMAEADKDESGEIDINEFINWLYDSSSRGGKVIHYGKALRALFDVYDTSGNGIIGYEEFEECHCILQGSLNLYPIRDEEDHPLSVIALNQSAEQAFLHANLNKDRSITFFEFVEFMCKMIDPKAITQEEFVEVTLKLTQALKAVLTGVKQAQRGAIREDESHILEAMIAELAVSTRNFQEALTKGPPPKKAQKWIDPPRGMSIAHLKAAHMNHMPVNMILVESFVFDVVCIPVLPHDKPHEDSEETTRLWIGEVVRKVKYFSGVERTEKPCFYMYEDENHSWKLMGEVPAERFENELKRFDPEFGLFCTMKCEADYGLDLDWKGVQRALTTGHVMGWISAANVERYVRHMQRSVLDKILDAEGVKPDNPDQAVQDFLYNHLVQRPRVIMATLSDLEIIDAHPAWACFMTHK